MVYPSVTREQEIPARAPMEVEDRESRKTVSVMLDLKRTSYENEHWQDGFEISVVFHEVRGGHIPAGWNCVMHDEKSAAIGGVQGRPACKCRAIGG